MKISRKNPGIKVDNINIQQHHENEKVKYIFNIILIIIGTFSTAGCFWTGFNIKISSRQHSIIAISVMLVLVCVITIITVYKPKMWIASTLVLAISLSPMVAGVLPDILPIVGIAVYLAAIAAIDSKDRILSIVSASVVLIVCIFISFIVPQDKYIRIQMFEDIREYIENMYTQKIAEIGEEVEFNNVAAGGVNDGELGKIDSIELTGQKMITLTTGSVNKLIYLRSYTGAVYRNNRWNELNSYRRYNRPENNEFDVYNQTAQLFAIIDTDMQLITSLYPTVSDYTDNVYKRAFSVDYENVGNKYLYLPYATTLVPRQKSQEDGYPINTARRLLSAYSYEVKDIDYDVYKNLVDSYSGTNTKMKSYKNWESEYRKFVHNSYLEIPKDFQSPVRYNGNDEAYIEAVKKYFNDEYTYTLSPGALPEGKDFVDYFMNETKEGYCTYFATAATLMFRAAGIPARYVEGYVAQIDDETAEKRINVPRTTMVLYATDSYNQYTINVLDKDAHAWAEIYKDGYGWIPVETTIGYADEQEVNDNYEETVIESYDRSEVSDLDDIVEELDGLDEENELDNNIDTQPITSTDENTQGFTRITDFLERLAAAAGIVIGMLIILWIVLHLISLYFEKKNRNMSEIIAMYNYFEKICRFLGYKRSAAMSYVEYGKYLTDNSRVFEAEKVDELIAIVLKAAFSEQKIVPEEDLNSVKEMLLKMKKDIYNSSTFMRKLMFRYIYHLY